MPRASLPLRSAALFSLVVASACTPSADPSGAPADAAPTWTDAPASVDLYEGRTTSIAMTVRAAKPDVVTVSASGEGVEAEVTPLTSGDGLWRGTLKLRLPYGAAAPASIRVAIAESGSAQATVPLAPKAHALAWGRRLQWPAASGPQTREHGIFVVDDAANAAYLLQGSGYSPQWKPVEDSWRLDLATGAWSPWMPTGDVPAPRAAHRVAVVPETTTAFVYGGYTGFDGTERSEAELYRLDVANAGHQFTKLTSVGAAPPRQLHTMAYDAKGERIVVFGGFTDVPRQDALDDAWLVKVEGVTATWTKVETSGPSARYGSFSAFDAESRRLVVWSGGQMPYDAADPVNAAADAWALDLSADPPRWSKLEPAGAPPPGRRNGCVMHDSVGRRLFVYGGTSDGRTTQPGLFVLDLEPGREAWTRLDLPGAPPPRSSGFGFATRAGDVTCAFGNDRSSYRDVSFLGYGE